MAKPHSLEDFYKTKFNWVPDNLKKEIGHFNIFNLEEFIGKDAKPIPYRRRDYYKISLFTGKRKFHYADKSVEVKKQCIAFSSPQIPYSWEYLEEAQGGRFCVFTPAFFHQFGNIKSYTVFQPGGTHVFELTDKEMNAFNRVFDRMTEELESDFEHKYDILRTLVLEVLLSAMKMQPSAGVRNQDHNASQRISILFLELLERQFPIEDPQQRVQLRSASDFADQLAIHTNHLNKALRDTSGKSTTHIIAERIMQEAKVLLKTSQWNVADIAYALSFKEVSHFNNFFKKHTGVAPMQFRN